LTFLCYIRQSILEQVEKMIISIASGKGGTGKTLVATSLALSLKDNEPVQFIDCDVEEPNAHILLKPEIEHSQPVTIPVPEIDKEKCNFCGKCAEVCEFNAIAVINEFVLTFSELCHGCGACSYFCPQNAITETGREAGVIEMGSAGNIEFLHGKLTIGEAMAPPLIRQLKDFQKEDKLVIIDVPPGTSCPVVEAVKDSNFCLLVTEPTPFGLNDLSMAVDMLRELDVPCAVVINRSGMGDEMIENYCSKQNIPVLMHIPLDINIAKAYSRGVSLVEGMPQWRESFIKLYDDIAMIVAERQMA